MRTLLLAALLLLSPTAWSTAWPLLQEQLNDALADPTLTEEEHQNLVLIQHSILTLTPRQGSIQLANERVELTVPEGYYYFSPRDSETILVSIWGNLPNTGLETDGLLMPVDLDPFEDASWAATLAYVHDGHVKDDDASGIDYGELLSQMKADTAESSAYRVEHGYEAIELVGWAAPPYYDQSERKLHWAKEIRFEGQEINTLNYDIRVLGREGYLEMGFIGSIDQLPQLEPVVPDVLAMASFTENNRYADFNPDVDQVAAYGIGGLIAGKALAKTGVLAAILMALKKFWVVIAAGLFGAFKWLFGRNKSD